MEKPFLTFSRGKVSTASRVFKAAEEKNAQVMRDKTVEEQREVRTRLAELLLTPPGFLLEEETIHGIPCEWVGREDSHPGKVIVFLHPGSWAFGNLRTARPTGALVSEYTGCKVLDVDYRLAPEHKYPAALNDCMAVYRHLLETGYEPEDIALFGASAGGNLALCMLHRCKVENLPRPACVACASPVTDLTEKSRIWQTKPDVLFTIHAERQWDIFELYAGGEDLSHPEISPIYGDLGDFPPLLIHVGEDEPLCWDNIEFARAAHNAGVDIQCKVWQEMFHDFSVMGIVLKESRQSLKEITAFLQTQLNLPEKQDR